MDEYQKRLIDLMEAVAEDIRPCKSCGKMLYFIRSRKTNHLMPMTMDGVNHFTDCPNANAHKSPAPRFKTSLPLR